MHSPQKIPNWASWLFGIVMSIIAIIAVASSSLLSDAGNFLLSIIAFIIPCLIVAFFAALFLLPTIIGRKSPRLGAIVVANLAFGWTGIGWILALIWALAEHGTLNKNPTQNVPPTP